LHQSPSAIAPTCSGPVLVRTAGGQKLMFADGSGAFRIDLGNGDVLHAIRCKLNKLVREYLAGPEKTVRALYLLLENGRKRARTKLARRGLWRIFEWDDQVAYAQWKIEAETIRFQAHPSYPALLEDARLLRNIGFFARHGQNGMRKVLMTGPPGTGKTSILMALAAELGRDMPVVLGNDDSSVVGTCAKAAAQARPCIVMVEEMDMLVRPTSATSAALGFLDGTDTPRNPAGTYLIATTNYPRRIDKRILKRPGRIDRVLSVAALRAGLRPWSRKACCRRMSIFPPPNSARRSTAPLPPKSARSSRRQSACARNRGGWRRSTSRRSCGREPH
jgi:ATPase family associated with various cellular activities (AAA)